MTIRPLIPPCIEYSFNQSLLLDIKDKVTATSSTQCLEASENEDSNSSKKMKSQKPSINRANEFSYTIESFTEISRRERTEKLFHCRSFKLVQNTPLLNIKCIFTPPEHIALKDKIKSLIDKKNLIFITENIIDTILKVHLIVWHIHINHPNKLLFISSKSHLFTIINQDIDKENAALDKTSNKYAKLSLRMFPSGVCSITIPNAIIVEGSCKLIKRELVIYPNFSLDFKRRCKTKKKTSVAHCINYTKMLEKTSKIKIKNIVSPEVIFYKKEESPPQFLMEDCDIDLYDFFSRIHNRSSSSNIYAILNMPLETQAHILLNLMIAVTVEIRDLHRAGYLHNDIKPENILLKIEEGTYRAKIADLDFVCDVKTGANLKAFQGTKSYCKDESPVRSIDTDLYALSKVFSYKKKESEDFIVGSFEYAFTMLKEKASECTKLELDDKISKIIECINTLCLDIESSCENIDSRKKINIDTILLRLSHLRADYFSVDPKAKDLASTDVKSKVKTHARSNSF